MNPFASHTTLLSSGPTTHLKKPPPEHLYGCLSTRKRSHAASKWEDISITEFPGYDPDIEILPGDESPEIVTRCKGMPKLKREKLTDHIVPVFPPKSVEKLKNRSLKPTIKEEMIYYEKNFSVSEFLKRSHNSRDYFLSDTRKCSFNPTCLDFLKKSFPTVTIQVIKQAYKEADYNMSAASGFLNRVKVTGKLYRKSVTIEAENISQLQEMEFVRKLYELPE